MTDSLNSANMLVKLNPGKPEIDKVLEVVKCLKDGGVIIYPTDSVYGLGCDITHKKAVEKLRRIKQLDPERASLTCVCESVKCVGTYAKKLSTPLYKMIKQAFPGPYTFILPASKRVPKHFQTRNTVGIRVVDHPIPKEIVHYLGNPIASISLMQPEEGFDWDYYTDPHLIQEKFGPKVDMVIDGGYGNMIPSTVIDCSEGLEFLTIVRQGMGELEHLGIELV